jgi:hypothetical protein
MGLDGDTGISAMMRAALWLEIQLDIDILNIWRGSFERSECTLEACGRFLAYFVVLDGGFVFLWASLMDKGNPPERLFSIGDTKQGWQTICKVIQALERNKVKSLERPIEAGSGPSGFVIDY